jgi:hypothetical protein
MDTTVRPRQADQWGVTDLLERAVCSIIRDPDDQFWIILSPSKLSRLAHVRRGPFTAVEGAMDAIEKNLCGICRHGAAVAPHNYFP